MRYAICFGFFCDVSPPTVTKICFFVTNPLWNSSAYASELAYIVDANVGRSSSAVALNSFFRGMAAFIGTEIAVPVQVCQTFLRHFS